MTVVLQAWAASPDDLDEWLPTATEFLDRVHFTACHIPDPAARQDGQPKISVRAIHRPASVVPRRISRG